ncbi:hypothetical protein A3860_34210 [Niastella vici]|uniref:Uncharacterized protein n=1 Tax=Niastella vici TaxID=1703345 RepID=A0A1V9FPE8_9BACT|nr:hypothetical protein [Niastella vici]OQP60136.1 hypothetical protein A3860_34210 [Niastella vici]
MQFSLTNNLVIGSPSDPLVYLIAEALEESEYPFVIIDDLSSLQATINFNSSDCNIKLVTKEGAKTKLEHDSLIIYLYPIIGNHRGVNWIDKEYSVSEIRAMFSALLEMSQGPVINRPSLGIDMKIWDRCEVRQLARQLGIPTYNEQLFKGAELAKIFENNILLSVIDLSDHHNFLLYDQGQLDGEKMYFAGKWDAESEYIICLKIDDRSFYFSYSHKSNMSYVELPLSSIEKYVGDLLGYFKLDIAFCVFIIDKMGPQFSFISTYSPVPLPIKVKEEIKSCLKKSSGCFH